ncbi:MAG: hypothetical protein EYC70_05525 [Planctomycetota bacterium]|nr:MAG: hypothetical protein EYC70_05525 [Planctomycetota bacterium]
MTQPSSSLVNRRNWVLGAGAAGMSALLARSAAAAPAAAPAGAALLSDPGLAPPWSPVLRRMCRGTPSNIQGPFYLDLDLLRRDITEGKPGLALTLVYQVVRVADCSPIPGAVVDVWHNDALGSYSGFASQGTAGQTWLRGIQIADSHGLVLFDTIYPGWYPGRTTHVHVKVMPTMTTELTTQFYFEDFISNAVYLQLPPYDQKGPNPTSNDQDAFYTPETKMPWMRDPNGPLHLFAGLRIGIH